MLLAGLKNLMEAIMGRGATMLVRVSVYCDFRMGLMLISLCPLSLSLPLPLPMSLSLPLPLPPSLSLSLSLFCRDELYVTVRNRETRLCIVLFLSLLLERGPA